MTHEKITITIATSSKEVKISLPFDANAEELFDSFVGALVAHTHNEELVCRQILEMLQDRMLSYSE